MARIIAGFGTPHTPVFPSLAARLGAKFEAAPLYGEIDATLGRLKLDALVIFSNDHFNTFFFDNFPLFAIGVAKQTSGPNDETPMPAYQVPLDEDLADHLRTSAINSGFDIAVTQEFTLDHAFMVPWHFLNAKRNTPVVPVFIHCFSDPLPQAARAFAFGRALGDAVTDYSKDISIAVIGSGSFSLEIGGPLAPAGERSGTPDKAWAAHIEKRLLAGDIEALIGEASCERMQRAGNAAGELLNWLAMLGMLSTLGPLPEPAWFRAQPDHGHAFGIWLAQSQKEQTP